MCKFILSGKRQRTYLQNIKLQIAQKLYWKCINCKQYKFKNSVTPISVSGNWDNFELGTK